LCDIWLLFYQGLDEEGLYRISGLAMAIDELKHDFETSAYCRMFFVFVLMFNYVIMITVLS